MTRMTEITRLLASRLWPLLLLLCFAHPALASETWRLAGTFNGWSATDDNWIMIPDQRATGRFELKKRLTPGSYTFKFVRDGAWERGHFGAAEPASDQLAQPGLDITLAVPVAAEYTIVLDPGGRTWGVRSISADEPFLDVRIVGPLITNREFMFDLRRTVTTSRWDPSMVQFSATNDAIGPLRHVDRERRVLKCRAGAPGPSVITVTLTDMGKTVTRAIEVDVLPEATLRWITTDDVNDVNTALFEPAGAGVQRAYITIKKPTQISVMELNPGEGEIVREHNFALAPGSYAAEIRGRDIQFNTAGAFPPMLIPGNWQTFKYKPRRLLDAVHLVGDFNRWARPGTDGAVEMIPDASGEYSATVNLPEGPNAYRFLLDGTLEVGDPEAKLSDSARGGPASVRLVGLTAARLAPTQEGTIRPSLIRHDPRTVRDFVPISRAARLADLSVLTAPGDAERVEVNLPTAAGAPPRAVPMRRSKSPDGFDRWTARVQAAAADLEYTFTLHAPGGASHTTEPHRASIGPELELPSWAMGAVWYQIFPERFRNGNPLNDPHGPSVYQMPWTDDWYGISAQEDAAWRARFNVPAGAPYPPRKGGNLFHVVWDRRYGGDLQGVAEKFDYLRSLGVTALYLNPIFEAESMHKYDATDYRHIDDNLATPASAGKVPETFEFKGEPADPASWKWTPADRYFVDEFLPAAKAAGIRVVLDGVFNHTGKPYFAFRDIMEKGSASPYKDWFYVEFDEAGKLKSWVSWFNTGALPKFKQTDNGDLVPPVKQHIFDITRRWMDPNGDGDPADGIDGWRLDVALDVGLPFWRDWRSLVKSVNPDAVIIAEIWDEADPHLTGDAFDTQMHYPFARAVTDWLGVRPGMSSTELAARLADAFDDAPQTNLIHQNLFGSHDTDRYVSMLQNPNRPYDDGNRPQDHDYPYRDVRPTAEIYARSLLGVAIQTLYVGAPMVYYGDEVGMWGADDPSDRKPFPWPDKGDMQNPDERADWDLHARYTKWLNLRADAELGPILRFGATRHLDSGDQDVFAFERSLNGRRVVAVINRKGQTFDAAGLLPAGTPDTTVSGTDARYWLLDTP
ncbi:MAG: alpha-amylase family glycosyl hydrolase [Planctomycetota bacterium]|nr:alpha-amylase family glycosyl hydrolase [Planctomycetota bacterium]